MEQSSAERSPTNISMHLDFSKNSLILELCPFTFPSEPKKNGLRVAFYRLYYTNNDYLVVLWLFYKCVTIKHGLHHHKIIDSTVPGLCLANKRSFIILTRLAWYTQKENRVKDPDIWTSATLSFSTSSILWIYSPCQY